MNEKLVLSKFVPKFIQSQQPESLLLLGQLVQSLVDNSQDTRMYRIETPFELNDLTTIGNVDLAIISNITEDLVKQDAIELLGIIRNAHAKRILIIQNKSISNEISWQLTDFLGMGFKTLSNDSTFHLYSYNILNYQQKRDWLNSRFWANPEYFNKFRW